MPQSRNQQARSMRHSNIPHKSRPPQACAEYVPVPPAAQIYPDVGVSITLKEDQGTGREVQGFVAAVLTKGDHPRGVKVCLVDGRVGRVQRIVSEGMNSAEDSQRVDRAEDSETMQCMLGEESKRPDLQVGTRTSLADYIVVKKQKPFKDNPMSSVQPSKDSEASMSLCPVCQDFEGDATAVAFHVEGHFR